MQAKLYRTHVYYFHFHPNISGRGLFCIYYKQSRLMTPLTLIPFYEVSTEQVFQMITCNENLKALTDQVRNAEIYEPPKRLIIICELRRILRIFST